MGLISEEEFLALTHLIGLKRDFFHKKSTRQTTNFLAKIRWFKIFIKETLGMLLDSTVNFVEHLKYIANKFNPLVFYLTSKNIYLESH